MSHVDHGWRHAPKAAGGTDPIPGLGGGIQFDTDNEGGWLYIQSNDYGPTIGGSGPYGGIGLVDSWGGGIGLSDEGGGGITLISNGFGGGAPGPFGGGGINLFAGSTGGINLESDGVINVTSTGVTTLAADSQQILLFPAGGGDEIIIRALDTGAVIDIEADGAVGISSLTDKIRLAAVNIEIEGVSGTDVDIRSGGLTRLGSTGTSGVQLWTQNAPIRVDIGNSSQAFTIYDPSATQKIFEVRGNGTVHIKSGGSVVADL